MTQLELAKAGIISPQLEQVAQQEKLDVNILQQGIAEGKIIILANLRHSNSTPCGIGKGLKTKVNANIGTSSDLCDVNLELRKLRMAIDTGANTVMDLSTGSNISNIRQAIIANSTIPVGTVPIYQAGLEAIEKHKALVDMKVDEIFSVIENQAKDGVDFITVHCGVTQASIARLKSEGRITSIVSRGGAFLTGWILHNGQENPLFQYYDRLLDIAHEYDVTLSLGDGFRPGCLADATDRAQVEELIILGEMVDRARKVGVQAMVEGPGHLPLDQIVSNVKLEKSLCHEAPFYVLGPLVTDIGAGYDHITGAIGGAIAAAAGTDFLCYVTPAEHLSLPDVDDVKQGVIASRLAAHVGDIAKGVADAKKWDEQMARARKDLNWKTQAELSLDPELSRSIHNKIPATGKTCSMCGKYCAMEIVKKHLDNSTNQIN
ncbi:MAG: phosphomethylpyrimidine synthase ThiC [Dehalococcoidia bacterium]|nr:phosphomethylpyrimidine synthase ThiC [Dehalococcoidia bacterium]